jgi:glycosyltransferase involved in cell wall biosynthesis
MTTLLGTSSSGSLASRIREGILARGRGLFGGASTAWATERAADVATLPTMVAEARPTAASAGSMAESLTLVGPKRPRRRPTVSVVIPALNEAKNLEHVLTSLPGCVFEVVLVDGGSTDGTPEVARRLRTDIHTIRQTRRGKGNALACGFAACTGDVIVTLDADGSADPGEIPRFVDALLAGADFAKGSRFVKGGGSADITLFRRSGNRFLMLLVNTLCATTYSDLCYGYNAFWAARCLPVFDLDWRSPAPARGGGRLWGDGFEIETLMNIRVAAAGLRVVEVPSYERRRLYGVSNLNAVRDGFRVLLTIARERRRALDSWNANQSVRRSQAAPLMRLSIAPAPEAGFVERRVAERRREHRTPIVERRSGADRRRQPTAIAV